MTETATPVPRFILRLAGAAFTACLLVAAAACGGGAEEEDAAAPAAAADPAADPAGDTAGAAADDAASVGGEVEGDGGIATGAAGEEFAAGDQVYVSVSTGGAAAGTPLEVVWYDPEGLEAAVVDGTVEGGERQALATDTAGWPAGTYRGEVWVGNELVDEVEIVVGEG